MSENLLYGLLWSLVILVPLLNAFMTSLSQLYLVDVLSAWSKLAPYFIIFLIHNRTLAPLLLYHHKYSIYALCSFVLISTIFAFVDYAQVNLLPTLDISTMDDDRPEVFGEVSFTHLNIFWNILLTLHMNAANLAIKLIYKSIHNDQIMAELTQQNLQVEMDYLKYQINPHFFMNTLNNIHALIDIDTESAKSTVIELSKMMRYILYESGNKSISLQNDLQFISNYIKLMKIRYDDSVRVSTSYPEHIPPNIAIPPLLFIVFVENAFKHGVRQDGYSYINIDIKFENQDQLSCRVTNSISEYTNDITKSTGIGLLNIQRRLELLYDNNFSLTTTANGEEYIAHLTIPIENR